MSISRQPPRASLPFTDLDHPSGVTVNTGGAVYLVDACNFRGQWLSQVDGPQEVSVSRTELSSLLA
ncbi:hypothetical protein [Mycobacterium heraklionense]|uniref:hypothetical protein n=1 Tax=Mycolicibacter heraklionensis TaxID=512402 RepID=UPI000D68C211